MDLELTHGAIIENTKGIGLIIKCMEKDNFIGLMVDSIKEIMLMIKNKVLEFIIGLIQESIKVVGKMENSMAQENISQNRVNGKLENGFKEKELDGLEINKLYKKYLIN